MPHSLWYWSWNKRSNCLFKHISVPSRGLEEISSVEMLYYITAFVVRRNTNTGNNNCIKAHSKYIFALYVQFQNAVFRIDDGLFVSSYLTHSLFSNTLHKLLSPITITSIDIKSFFKSKKVYITDWVTHSYKISGKILKKMKFELIYV